MNTTLIKRIVALGEEDEDIRAIILEGSFTADFQVDELSDYDINIFSSNYEKYLIQDGWMARIGEVLLYQKEHLEFYDTFIPTRLVLLRDRERVDFSFWKPELLDDIIRGEKVYASYKNGYQILVDKDQLACQLKPPDGSGFVITFPSCTEFLQTIYDFWFEAYCVARYLSRKDLWFAKRIENSYIKDHLYQMALWHHQANNDWRADPLLHIEGKRFERWASAELIESISKCFSMYEIDGTWKSLFAMLDLFQGLAHQTALELQIEYPEQVERDMLSYLEYLKNR